MAETLFETLFRIVLWITPLVILFLFVRKPLGRWIDRKHREITWTPPVPVPASLRDRNPGEHLAPEVYAVPFQLDGLLGMARNPAYPKRNDALEYMGQYFKQESAKPSKDFERASLELSTDPAVGAKTISVLKIYCDRFRKPRLLTQAENARAASEAKAREDAVTQRPQEVLLLLGTALNDGRRVKVDGRELTSIEDCIPVVFSAEIGAEFEVGIESGGRMVREKMVFRYE